MTTVEELARRGRKTLRVHWRLIERDRFCFALAAFTEDWEEKIEGSIGLVTNQSLIEITYKLPNADIPMLKEEIGNKYHKYFISEPYIEED